MKELAVAVLFGLGATVAAWPSVHSIVDVATIVLFSGLCWINCIAIERWESGRAAWPVSFAAIVAGCAALVLIVAGRPVLGEAEMASAIAFLFLDAIRRRLSKNALRVLADVALLSPVFFLPGLRP
jgi:hypothetical protein